MPVPGLIARRKAVRPGAVECRAASVTRSLYHRPLSLSLSCLHTTITSNHRDSASSTSDQWLQLGDNSKDTSGVPETPSKSPEQWDDKWQFFRDLLCLDVKVMGMRMGQVSGWWLLKAFLCQCCCVLRPRHWTHLTSIRLRYSERLPVVTPCVLSGSSSVPLLIFWPRLLLY